MDGTTLAWSLLFGSVGLGYAVYGRRQRSLVPLLAGIGLIVLPFVVDGTAVTLGLGALLLALPFVVKP